MREGESACRRQIVCRLCPLSAAYPASFCCASARDAKPSDYEFSAGSGTRPCGGRLVPRVYFATWSFNMKITTIAVATAALFGAVSIGHSQNAPTQRIAPSPASINKSNRPTMPSGNESQASATGTPRHVVGRGKYCAVFPGRNTLDCRFASNKACESHGRSKNMLCVTNPRRFAG